MKIRIALLWPYEFTAELNFGGAPGAVAYFVQDVSVGPEHVEAPPPVELTREAYLAITAGRQVGCIAQIADALDVDGLVACGQGQSIAQSPQDLAACTSGTGCLRTENGDEPS
jgi:hypothetical protein